MRSIFVVTTKPILLYGPAPSALQQLRSWLIGPSGSGKSRHFDSWWRFSGIGSGTRRTSPAANRLFAECCPRLVCCIISSIWLGAKAHRDNSCWLQCFLQLGTAGKKLACCDQRDCSHSPKSVNTVIKNYHSIALMQGFCEASQARRARNGSLRIPAFVVLRGIAASLSFAFAGDLGNQVSPMGSVLPREDKTDAGVPRIRTFQCFTCCFRAL